MPADARRTSIMLITQGRACTRARGDAGFLVLCAITFADGVLLLQGRVVGLAIMMCIQRGGRGSTMVRSWEL